MLAAGLPRKEKGLTRGRATRPPYNVVLPLASNLREFDATPPGLKHSVVEARILGHLLRRLLRGEANDWGPGRHTCRPGFPGNMPRAERAESKPASSLGRFLVRATVVARENVNRATDPRARKLLGSLFQMGPRR